MPAKRALVVDDARLARVVLSRMLENYKLVVDTSESAEDALEYLASNKPPHVIFMDHMMPGMDGLEAAMHLMGMEQPPSVIFTTAYDQHALDAFEVNAVDYLLKPIRKDRLANALTKAHKLTAKQLREVSESRKEPQQRTHISVHLRGNIRLVPVQEVIYFLADSKYVVVRTDKEEHLIEDSLVNLEKEFGERFLRVHRNALIATPFIKGIEKTAAGTWQVALKGTDKKLDVSRRHTAAVRRWARNRPKS